MFLLVLGRVPRKTQKCSPVAYGSNSSSEGAAEIWLQHCLPKIFGISAKVGRLHTGASVHPNQALEWARSQREDGMLSTWAVNGQASPSRP